VTQQILVRRGYVLSYDRRTRNAHWVAEHLTANTIKVRLRARGERL
jgi:DNA/RNA endonuclease G (NUC1)